MNTISIKNISLEITTQNEITKNFKQLLIHAVLQKTSCLSLFMFFLISFFSLDIVNAQNINIIPQLKKIEAGKIEDVKNDLLNLKQKYPGSPNIIFLEAVITEDGEKSQKFYELVYKDFPDSRFADAALFRSFSYYYALGLYKKAEELKRQLQKEYPKSSYLKNTDRNFPETDEMIIIDSTPYKIKNQSGERFTVQVGAFSNYKNAEELKSKFIRNGYSSKISPKNVNNIRLHIVTVGNFTSRSKATYFLNDLQNKYSIKGRIKHLE